MAPFILLSADEMRRAEEAAIKGGIAGASLMEEAGKAVATVAMRGWDKRPVAVICGPGNNGGDGFVVARRLADAGWPVRVGLMGEKSALSGDAKIMADLYQSDVEILAPGVLEGAGLIIDALFGTGLSRALDGAAKAIVIAVNSHAAPVLSVDFPSGINADTGAVMGGGDIAVRAARTVTFFLKKSGHVLFPGRAFCGVVDVADIGIAADIMNEINPATVENNPVVWAPAFRRPSFSAHKYSRGAAAIISGPRLATGAARLAARAALRSGAGVVTLLSPANAADENAAQTTSIMVREADTAEAIVSFLKDKRFSAVLIGPGAGISEETSSKTLSVLRACGAVLDADALTSFEGAPAELFAALKPDDVLTPHAGEFERLFNELDDFPDDRLKAVRAAAAKAGSVIVLKGADTIIAGPKGRAAINTNAPFDLATAGAGDVLAGIITGLKAQGMPGFEAAMCGVWLHGACAQAAGPGLIADDLPEALPAVLRALLAPQAPRPQDNVSNNGNSTDGEPPSQPRGAA